MGLIFFITPYFEINILEGTKIIIVLKMIGKEINRNTIFLLTKKINQVLFYQ